MLLLLVMLCMNACSMFMPPEQKFDGGELLDSEGLSEIKSQVFSSENSESVTEETTVTVVEKTTETTINSTEITEMTESLADLADTVTEETESSKNSETVDAKTEITEGNDAAEEKNGDIVYWIASGEVWHLSRDCRYIKDKSIDSGSVEEAMAAGKSRVCSVCGK